MNRRSALFLVSGIFLLIIGLFFLQGAKSIDLLSLIFLIAGACFFIPGIWLVMKAKKEKDQIEK